jgi:hypothetical protein
LNEILTPEVVQAAPLGSRLDPGDTHPNDEFVLKKDLETAVEMYVRLVKDLVA